MPERRRLTDTELQRLDEAALFRHLVACRDAGRANEATRATWLLLARHYDDILARLELKLPPHAAQERVSVVIEKAVGATFSGTGVKQLYKLFYVIADRVIAEFHRSREGAQLRQDQKAGNRLRDDEDIHAEPSDEDPGFANVEYYAIIDDVLRSRSPDHRAAIEGFLFERRPAREVADALGTTEANVNQIVRRFKVECQGEAGP